MSKVIHANGARTDDPATMKWNDIMNEVVKLGGVQRGNVVVFPSEDARKQFADWYAQNAAQGLYVRTAASLRVPPVVTECKTLKQVRMWHWREVLNERRLQRKYEARAEQYPEGSLFHRKNMQLAKPHRELANLHLSAVQALNDVLPGTAEQDCAQADQQT